MNGRNSNPYVSSANWTRFREWLPWVILVALGFGPLFLCASLGPENLESDLGLKAAPDWSRGLPVGTGFYGTTSGAPFVVDEQRKAHLVWAVRSSADEHDLHYARLDDLGIVEEEHNLNLGLREPREVRLLLDGEGLIGVFLLALPGRGEPSSLFHLRLNGDGQLETAPIVVSSGRGPSYEYDVTARPDGTFDIFWTEDLDVGSRLFHSKISPDLETAAAPRLLATNVSGPVSRTGHDGRIHLLWEQPGRDEETTELYYTALTDEPPASLSGIKLLDLPSGPRVSRMGPVLALDHEYAYLVWTEEFRLSRVAPETSEAWYASFAFDSPSSIDGRSFSLPMDERPTYVVYDSPYNVEYLVPFDGEREVASERIAEPSPLGAQDEAVVSFGSIVRRGLGRESQITNVIFADGELIGYQLACNTMHWSRLPNLSNDPDGNLHLSWADGLAPGPSDVFYATTSPLVRERVDHIAGDDLLLAVLNTAFSAATGVALLPFVVLWIVPSLVWVFISGFFLGPDAVRSLRGYVALAIALLVYQVGKVYFTPALFDYVPFSVSVPFLPPQFYAPLQVLTPVLIAAVGTVAVIYTLLRVEARSVFTAWLAFILSDAFLTTILYGPGLAPMA
jgi:hypothetical protein